jgi:putative nucleotidyltransferase with HDIG domain
VSGANWLHLPARLLDFLTSKALTGPELSLLDGWLRPEEAKPFAEQPVADQRHSYQAAALVMSARGDRPDLVRAALLHDIGKRHSRLGWLARSVVTLTDLAGIPWRGRGKEYLNHDHLGADELAALGAEPLVVSFARNHHSQRPQEIATEDWMLLKAADAARRPWESQRVGVSPR